MIPDACLEPEEMTDHEWDEYDRRQNIPAFTRIDYEKDRLRYDLEFNNWLEHTTRGL